MRNDCKILRVGLRAGAANTVSDRSGATLFLHIWAIRIGARAVARECYRLSISRYCGVSRVRRTRLWFWCRKQERKAQQNCFVCTGQALCMRTKIIRRTAWITQMALQSLRLESDWPLSGGRSMDHIGNVKSAVWLVCGSFWLVFGSFWLFF